MTMGEFNLTFDFIHFNGLVFFSTSEQLYTCVCVNLFMSEQMKILIYITYSTVDSKFYLQSSNNSLHANAPLTVEITIIITHTMTFIVFVGTVTGTATSIIIIISPIRFIPYTF